MFIVYENLGQPGARKIREFGTEREARQFIADYYFWGEDVGVVESEEVQWKS